MKAQMSTEFMFMIMAATGLLLVFMYVFTELYNDNLYDKKMILAEDFGYSVQNEFVLAAEAKHGYYREFTLPSKVEGFDYEILNLGTVLQLNISEATFQFPIPYANGTILKGPNLMRKYESEICINC